VAVGDGVGPARAGVVAAKGIPNATRAQNNFIDRFATVGPPVSIVGV
jgi:hypothetical protein